MTAPWHLPPDLRPAEQAEPLSVDAKLLAARTALEIVLHAVVQPRSRISGKRWNNRERLDYITAICENALRRVR